MSDRPDRYAVCYVNWKGQWTQVRNASNKPRIFRSRASAERVLRTVKKTVAENGRATVQIV